MENKEILLGLHTPKTKDYVSVIIAYFSSKGFNSTHVDNLPEMLNMLDPNKYSHVFMDLNLGNYGGSEDINPAKQVFSKLEKEIKAGKVKFLGVSASKDVVAIAENQGIPSSTKDNFKEFEKFLAD